MLALAAFGFAAMLAINAVFAPWSYYLGGPFHLLPMWQGWGRMHTDSGDYLLYISMWPTSGSRGRPGFSGTAALWTPRGETYRLRLTGGMPRRVGLNTDQQHVLLSVYTRRWSWGLTGDRRPDLGFNGAWHNPDLVMDDGGSLTRAFNPDGTLRSGPPPKQAAPSIPITFHAGGYFEFRGACRQMITPPAMQK